MQPYDGRPLSGLLMSPHSTNSMSRPSRPPLKLMHPSICPMPAAMASHGSPSCSMRAVSSGKFSAQKNRPAARLFALPSGVRKELMPNALHKADRHRPHTLHHVH
eukprot:355048-Chlamydomonas_euryale.AAC.10